MRKNKRSTLEELKKTILALVKEGKSYDKECDELLELAIAIPSHIDIAFSYIYKAMHALRSDYNVVNEYLLCASEHLDFNQPSRLLQLYYNLSNTYHNYINDTQASVQDCLEGLNVSLELDDKVAVAVFYNNIGEVFLTQEDYKDAYIYLVKAHEMMKECKEIHINYKIAILCNLSLSSLLSGNFTEALSYIRLIESENLLELNYRHELYMLYLSYYTSIDDDEHANKYYDLLLNEHFEIDRNQSLTFDYLLIMCKSMIHFNNQKESERIFKLLEPLEDKLLKGLEIRKARLSYFKQFGTQEQMQEQYEKYYENFIGFEKQQNSMKMKALQLKIRLSKSLDESDILQEQVNRLEDEVNLDNLTGLQNRRYLNITQMNLDKKEDLKTVCFIMLDVDYFKEYNDVYGHIEGDNVLKTVAHCIQEVTNDNLQGFRYGGDEFCCLGFNTENEEIEKILDTILAKLKKCEIVHSHSECSDRVTLSIGYCNQPYEPLMDMYAFFKKADRALYESKGKGRNRYTCYDVVD